jgi:hypothetical protein
MVFHGAEASALLRPISVWMRADAPQKWETEDNAIWIYVSTMEKSRPIFVEWRQCVGWLFSVKKTVLNSNTADYPVATFRYCQV